MSNLRTIVLAQLPSEKDKSLLRALIGAIIESKTVEIGSTSLSKGNLVEAFDSKGVFVGKFNQDSGEPIAISLKEYKAATSASPTPAQHQKADAADTTNTRNDSSKSTPTNYKTWKFEQFAHGAKWEFVVYYRLSKTKSQGFELVAFQGLRNGKHYVYSETFKVQNEAKMITFRQKDYWWTFEFQRSDDESRLCSVSYEEAGTPLIGWDQQLRKEGRCEI